MALNFTENRYPGVNAHLTSFLLQPDGGWESFHAEWIVHLRQALDAQLPANYYAIAEKSLQISELANDTLSRTRPDVSVYQVRPSTEPHASRFPGTTPTAVIALSDVLEEMIDTLTSVGIYETTDGKVPGRLVTRIEVLSPGNKPSAPYASQYLTRRYETLTAGVNLLEIDLIYTRRPIISAIPSYPDAQNGATPSVVLVSRPTPQPQNGQLLLYNVSIDTALPQVAVPLMEDETLVLDLQAVYNQTFADTRIFPMLVDYGELPANIEHFTPNDQKWIQQFLVSVLG